MKKINFLFLIYALLFLGIRTTQAQSVSTTVLTNVTCHGQSNGSITCTPSGGTTPYTYLWSPGSETTQTATGLSAATYTITLTDYLAHTASASASMTQPAALSVTASAKFSSVCPGQSDSIFASASGGKAPFTYLWTAPYDDISCPTCSKTNSYPYGVAYMVTAVYDGNGCTATSSVNITVHPFPYVTISGPINPIAPGRADTLIAHATGATTYAWSNSSTASAIRVTPSVSTTYSVTVHNAYGCLDTAHYTIDTNSVGNGTSSGNAIRIVPGSTLNMASFSTTDSVVWFSFVPTDSNNQIIANSAYLGMPIAHVHRLTLFNNSLQTIVDEPMPDIVGANQIRIDISHLDIGSTYYVRASRCPAHANMAGCNPSASGECNPTQRWDFQMGFRTVPVFVPDDSGAEAPSISQLYYECRGQKEDLNGIPRFDVKAYTDNASPGVFASDSAVSFVYQHTDTSASFIDTFQRVDMVLTGESVQPSQPVFKMEEDSGAGYLNYYLGYAPNGVNKVEGYSRLVYKNIYANVDMQVYSNDAGTKLYFICNSAASGGSAGNPANIELQFKGASSVSVNGSNGLDIVTELGTLSFAPGYAYTDSAGIIKPKSWQPYFISVNSNTVRFNTGSYNTNEPLIIRVDRGHQALPPSANNLEWSTYCGGSNDDCFIAIRNDGLGSNEVAAGYSKSSNFPVSNGAYKGTIGGAIANAIIVSFNANNVRNWSTYFGGSVAPDQDMARAVTTDTHSNIYITGNTNSADFPPLIPAGAFNNPGGFNDGDANGGPYDAFIVELSESGGLIWSTYFGGIGSEVGEGIVTDGNNNLYVVGGQMGYNITSYMPTLQYAGGFYSTSGIGWVAKFNTSHAQVWTTDIGGNIIVSNGGVLDAMLACDVDGANNLYVTGAVNESGFPVNGPSPLVPYVPGAQGNAVLAKFDGSSLAMDWATNYGGDGYETGSAIVANGTADGNVYITGQTTSPLVSVSIPTNGAGGYPAYQTSLGGTGTTNAYIAGFSQSSGALVYGTYFGGNDIIFSQGITWNNGIYITGEAYSASLPIPRWGNPPNTWNVTSIPVTQVNNFVAFFPYDASNNTNHLPYNWGTYFGGNGRDNAYAAMSTNTGLYIVGSTTSTNFPINYNGSPTPWYQANYRGAGNQGVGDAFISEFALAPTLVGLGVDNLPSANDGVKAYPNPATENITVQIESQEEQNMEFVLYNLLGQPVYSNIFNEYKGSISQEIPLTSLANGTYILEVRANGNTYHQKITKLQ